MKKLVLIVGLFVITGCASTQLPSSATPEQKKAARCSDASSALELGRIGLSLAMSDTAKIEYWNKWIDGASRTLAVYCR